MNDDPKKSQTPRMFLEDETLEDIIQEFGHYPTTVPFEKSLYTLLGRILEELVVIKDRLYELENPDRPRVEQGKARQ